MKIWTLFYLILFSVTAHAQSTLLEHEKFGRLLNRNVKVDLLPDSDVLLTLNIQITVNKNSKPRISSSDSLLFNKIGVLKFLENYNYTPLMGELRKVKFIVPIGLVVASSKYGPKSIDLHITNKLSNLFYNEKLQDADSRIIYLSSLMILVDKKVYD